MAVGVALGAWGVLVCFTALQISQGVSLDWADALLNGLHFWVTWPLLSLPAILLSFYFPVERPRWPWHLGLHAVAAALLVWLSTEAREHHLPPERLAAFLGIADPQGPMFRQGPGPPWGRGRPRGSPPRPRGQPFRMSFDFLLYAGVASACHAATFLRRSRQRERQALALQASLAQANLQALRMQLNPHFLFNTLNAISTLIHSDPDAADRMIGHLSELLRASLDTREDQEIPLRKELDLLEHYLAIEKRRFGDRLAVEVNIPGPLLDGLVPTLMLQPLVENAVKHGIESSRRPGLICLLASREGNRWVLHVRNRARGGDGTVASTVPCESSSERPSPGHGIGLANARARLRQLHGDGARLEAGPDQDGGFSVRIELPWRETQDSTA